MTSPEASNLLVEVDSSGVATLTLNRPKVHNAFDEALISGLSAALDELAKDESLRALVLAAEGKSFSSGADINMMRRAGAASLEENRAHAVAMAGMLSRLDRFATPTLALVQGAALAVFAAILMSRWWW